ncbi:unnamed protein product [Ranitomeya imitator]|uniref:Uncharacterized protein n=1 Tax=Ranitomeya imitator TaxID=111125 RepID=A0ABN9L908_9NEOB|nr:unnamed protein product [Ranitomeya imitator]
MKIFLCIMEEESRRHIFRDASSGGPPKQRLSDSTHPNHFLIRSDPEPVTMYSPEQTSLHERSLGNSRSSTQMNSYSDSGYQEAGTFHNHNVAKPELRQQHSFSGSTSNHLVRSSRAEGQTIVQPTNAMAANRAVRRVSSVPSRSQSPSYVIGSGVSPSRGSLRTSLGSGYGSPSTTDSRPLPASTTYSSTTLPSQRAASPYTIRRSNSPTGVRRIGSLTSRQNSNPNGITSNYQTLGLRSSYASQHSQLGQELRSAVSPDLQITPIYEGRTYYSPVYRNANHGTIELRQGSQTAVYRTGSDFSVEMLSFLYKILYTSVTVNLLLEQFRKVEILTNLQDTTNLQKAQVKRANLLYIAQG